MFIAGVTDNPFRILGVSSVATREDAWKAMQSIDRARRLRKLHQNICDFEELLGFITRNEETCNFAFGTLENNPSKRILNRLLWFDPTHFQQGRNFNVSNEHTYKHDAALHSLILLVKYDPFFEQEERWVGIVDEWRDCLEVQSYWTYLKTADEESSFGRRLKDEEFVHIMDNKPQLPLDVLITSAKRFIGSKAEGAIDRIYRIGSRTSLAHSWEERFRTEILAFLEDSIDAEYRVINRALDRINRKGELGQDVLLSNKDICDKAYLSVHSIRKKAELLTDLPSVDPRLIDWTTNITAQSLHEVAMGYTWAHQWKLAGFLLMEAEQLVPPTLTLSAAIKRTQVRIRPDYLLRQLSELCQRVEATASPSSYEHATIIIRQEVLPLLTNIQEHLMVGSLDERQARDRIAKCWLTLLHAVPTEEDTTGFKEQLNQLTIFSSGTDTMAEIQSVLTSLERAYVREVQSTRRKQSNRREGVDDSVTDNEAKSDTRQTGFQEEDVSTERHGGKRATKSWWSSLFKR